MAGRRIWLRACIWLVLLLSLALLAATAVGWVSAQRWLREQGIQLDWQGLGFSGAGLSLERLEVLQTSGDGAQLHARAERLKLSWDYFPLQLQRLHIDQLNVAWQPPAVETAGEDSPLELQRLRQLAAWLPQDLHIERLHANLPCATGRCPLDGAVRLRHEGAIFPAHLELLLRRGERRLQLLAQLQGEPQDARLDLSLALDEQPRLALNSDLTQNPGGWLWSGRLELPDLPEAPWLLDWLDEWRGPPEQPLPAPPDALSLRGNWHLQLPGPLNRTSLERADGNANFTAQLPAPWPLPGIGRVQGHLAMAMEAKGGRWFPTHIKGDIELSEPSDDWLAKLPAGLRPSALRLRIQPGEGLADSPLLPLGLQLSSQGPAELKLNATLGVTRAPPWALELDQAHLHGQVKRLQLPETDLRALDLDLRLSGRMDENQFSFAFGQGSQLKLATLGTDAAIRLEHAKAELEGLAVEGRHTNAALESLSVQGQTRLQAQRVYHPQLQPQGWLWQGRLDADLGQVRLDGTLSADAGVNLSLTIHKAFDGPLSAEARLQEIFFRASNPLAKTLTEWPGVLELNSGRLQGEAKLQLPSGRAPPSLQLQLTFKGLTGIYDRSELNGLDGRGQLHMRANRLHLEIPELKLKQANPGVVIGPLRIQASYDAPVPRPLAGRLSWQLAESALLGGRVWLEPGSWNLTQPSGRLPLHIEGVDIERLLRAYPAEGLAGTGILDGLLPLHISEDGLRVDQGSLAARAPGQLQFHSERIQALGRSNPAMQLVAEALENFHYSLLSSEVSYDEQGKLLLNLRLEGRNPDIENGRPIHFNINLEEDIPALLTSLQLSDRVNETIQRRVQDYLRQKRAQSP